MSDPRDFDDSSEDSSDIAIVGLALRFPGASSAEEYWANLRAGVESISFFTDEELRAEGVAEELLADSSLVKAGAPLPSADQFDAGFFGFNRREAEITDPQHRLLLECGWEALESAGYDAETFAGSIGLFAGCSLSTYLIHNLVANRGLLEAVGAARAIMGNCNDFLTTWVSYKLNLRGPSVTVGTACSTSLVAVHLAWQSLLNGESDIALAGASSISLPQKGFYRYREGGIQSPDGHCRAFDADAAGTVSGNGVGVVVLRRLSDALADGAPILGVIKGSAVNNDGSGKIGYTAPSITGQAAVVAEALAISGVDPETIGYVEAHGTGTNLGDPIEIGALTRAFRASTAKKGFCAIGSAKTNIGHLDTAAGVAGLVKAIFAMRHGEIPPSLHFRAPNPKCDFPNSPFFVADRLLPWPRNGEPRRAGVSSLGIGGTNAHLIVEEAPETEPSDPPRPWELLVLSARTPAALDAAAGRLREHLRAHPGLNLGDAAFTGQVGRRAFPHRLAVACRGVEDAVRALDGQGAMKQRRDVQETRNRPVAFLFPGQGAQRAGMGRELYEAEPRFREEVDKACELLRPALGFDLRQVLLASGDELAEAERRLARTDVAQPALFVVEHALARLWMSWGIRPHALLGHSLGEYVAACLAGVFSLKDALALVAERGRLMQGIEPGVMVAVSLPEAELPPYLDGDLSLASVNAPSRCVVSGPAAAVEALEARLAADGVAHRRLATAHAFHSRLTEPVLDAFGRAVARVRLSPPAIPCLSNLTGTWLQDAEATDPGYWVRHLRSTVRFDAAVEELLREPERVLLEVGPGRTLGSLVRQRAQGAAAAAGRVIAASLGEGREPEPAVLMDALGQLWTAGLKVDWAALHEGERRCRLPLPTYPFERQRYWIDPPKADLTPQPPLPSPSLPPPGEGETAAADPLEDGGRRGRILDCLYDVVHGLVGLDRAEVDTHASFPELGVDSLLLIQFSQSVQRRLGMKLSLTQLLEEAFSLEAVAAFLDRELPPDALAAPAPTATVSAPPAVPSTSLERILEQQTQILARLTDLLAGSAGSRPALAAPVPALPAPAPAPLAPPPVAALADELTPRQQRHLDALIERYSRRTRESKCRTDEQRASLADNRASAGFRLRWKELVYPLIADRSAGSRFWDIDGNEYVDIAMGFGVNLLGHAPEIVTRAVQRQLERGMQIGPQSDLAGEVAAGIRRLTGVDRVAFTNSGTEAVMGALRIARAVTGRRKIALFSGSYHGSFDGVLVRGLSRIGKTRPIPVAPGVPLSLVEDVVLLPYGDPAALDTLRQAGAEIAAVLVEPVQSRQPDLQPWDFLRDLRRVADEIGAALVFDEVISGFRSHPGGVQALTGVRADLVTYGKVIGGGMPIGIVAGRAAYMDAIDGGAWRFGDSSSPTADKTFFTGTFCKHPLAMAGALAVVRHLEERGPALQEDLNRRSAEMRERLNAWFEAEAMPVRMIGFSSLFLFRIDLQVPAADLFFFHLIENGVYVWEGHTCYLSTAHTDEDVEILVRAVQASAQAMREGGFFPGPRTPEDHIRLLPMTPAQEQLWILAQMGEEASRAYNESVTLHLRGDLDPEALQRALQTIADRHDALRTTFGDQGQSAEMQRIAPRVTVELPRIDLSPLPEGERRAQLDRHRREEASRLFDLERGPLLRACLLRLAPDLHAVILSYHHIAVDGRSLGVLLSELTRLYEADRAGLAASLPEPERTGDHLAREVERQESPAAAEALEWWRAQLAPPLPALELPADRPRPALFSYRGGREEWTLGPELLAELRALSGRRGSTLLLTLFAGFCALLHRLSGQEELVAAVPSIGARDRGRPFVGYDLNLLPVRSRVSKSSGSVLFTDLLAALKRQVAEAWDHRDAPFHAVVRRLGLEPDFSRPQLASVVFNLDRAEAKSRFGGLEMEVQNNPTGGAKLELFLNAVDYGDRVWLDCEHYLDLFDGPTVRRWLRHLATLLAGAARDPERPVADLPLLSPAERHHLLREWNDSESFFRSGSCLHRLFEERAARSPESFALSSAGERLTYAELNARANRLARHLARLGVGPEVPVGVCLERTPDLVVSLLAVLKAGGAYVPLDPAYPLPRLALMVEDALAPGGALITRGDLLDRLPRLPETGTRIVRLDADSAAISTGRSDDLREGPWSPLPENLAYILYTSGSTGRPKGVQIPHRALVNFLASMAERPGFQEGERLMAVTSLSFDIAGLEIYLPLLAGGEVVLSGREDAADGLRLLERLSVGGIDILQATPSTWQLLLEAGWRDGHALRALCGGEALPRALAARLAERSAAAWNLYGPTETTIWSAVARVDGGEEEGWATLGRPIANTGILLLDSERRPVPVGVAGELYIGGEGLARGYRGRPDLTAERFVPHPFAARPGERLYRTGDLARFRPDGRIEFLGRADLQVKVRGFRIELGDVEAALAQHPAVREAVAVARKDPREAAEGRLVAYIVRRAGEPATADELRAFAAALLPAYMVPSTFVDLDAFPLTPNGKVDRKALPEPAGDRPGRSFLAPRSELERQIAEVWQSVLQVDRVGIDDSFFDLGGQSLSLLRVRRRLRDLGHEVAPTDLFRHPTIGALAAHLGRNGGAEEAPRDEGYIDRLREGRNRLTQRLEKRRT